jgi:cell division septation protein DedD
MNERWRNGDTSCGFASFRSKGSMRPVDVVFDVVLLPTMALAFPRASAEVVVPLPSPPPPQDASAIENNMAGHV